MKTCRQCNTGFKITDSDRQFYERMQVPEPKLCPICRQRRRLMCGDQINLYKRKCDGTGEEIISAYHPDSPFKVYKQAYWYGDKWDALTFGREFDFGRPFFEQWYELAKIIPRPALFGGFSFHRS